MLTVDRHNSHESNKDVSQTIPFNCGGQKKKITAGSCSCCDSTQHRVEKSGHLVSIQKALSARDDEANLYKNGMEIKTSEGIMDLGN